VGNLDLVGKVLAQEQDNLGLYLACLDTAMAAFAGYFLNGEVEEELVVGTVEFEVTAGSCGNCSQRKPAATAVAEIEATSDSAVEIHMDPLLPGQDLRTRVTEQETVP
jgi:hypothetical protein